MIRPLALSLMISLSFWISSCSSKPKKFDLKEIYTHELRMRHSDWKPVDPRTGPGGQDFKNTPGEDPNDFCQKFDDLLKGLPLKKINRCLASIETAQTVEYEIEWSHQPVFKIDVEDEDIPSCLRSSLPKFKVPREVYFLARRKKKLTCFSSRLNVETGEFMGSRFFPESWSLKIQFPLLQPPESTAQLSRLLKSWMLSPFFDTEEGTKIGGTPMPDHICRRCFGNIEITHEMKKAPPSWP